VSDGSELRAQLGDLVDGIIGELDRANEAREVALRSCRSVVRLAGSAIRAVHRRNDAEAVEATDAAERALRDAQTALGPHPDLQHAGFLHDAEKEYVEARLTRVLVAGGRLADARELGVDPRSWMKGLVEAASELRRHLLDRMRDGDLTAAETLVRRMEEVYDALVVVDFPDALTLGLRRTLDALRAVLERSRADVTTTAVQARLWQAIERFEPGSR
jgi:translin